MTAVYPARTDRAYRGVIYGYDILDHDSIMDGAPRVVMNDYVGQTRQRGRGRDSQHRDDKPWADLIVGSPRVLWEDDCTKAELDEMERHFIQDVPLSLRPRMNWKLNEDNPRHIPIWEQIEQRHERDDAMGRPRWQPPEQRSRDSLLEWTDRASPVRQNRSGLTPAQWRLIGWGSAWLVLWITGWYLIGPRLHLATAGRACLISAALAAGLLTFVKVWLWLGRPIKWSTWKRRVRRKLRKPTRRKR